MIFEPVPEYESFGKRPDQYDVNVNRMLGGGGDAARRLYGILQPYLMPEQERNDKDVLMHRLNKRADEMLKFTGL